MSRRDDWQEQLDRKKDANRIERTRQATAIRHAEVSATKLAATPEWQRFQQMLQGVIEMAKEELAGIGPALLEPDLVSHDALLTLKVRGSVLVERITTLENVIELPKLLQDDGEDAQKELEELAWLKTAS